MSDLAIGIIIGIIAGAILEAVISSLFIRHDNVTVTYSGYQPKIETSSKPPSTRSATSYSCEICPDQHTNKCQECTKIKYH